MIVCTVYPKYRYSGLSTDEKPVPQDEVAVFWETDTGREYEWRDGTWHELNTLSRINDTQALVIYQSGNYMYVCLAAPGSLKTAAAWQIKRVDTSNLIITWADGNALFDNVATNVSTVAALTYL